MSATKNQNTLDKKSNVSAEVSSLGKKLFASMPSDAFDSFTKSYDRYLPDSHITLVQLPEKNSTMVSFNISAEPSVVFDRTGITVNVKQTEKSEQIGSDAAILLSQLLEKELNTDGIFSLNSSCISYKGNCALFLGDSGSGKTTSVLYACLSNNQIRLVSGKRVYVNDNGKILGGISKISIRSGSVSAEFIEFQKAFSEVERNRKSNSDKKLAIAPELLGIKRETNYPLELKNIVFVKKLDQPLAICKVDTPGDDEFFRAYSSLGDGGGVLSSNKLPVPFIFDYTDRTKRAKFAEQLLSTTNLNYVQGRLPDIADFVLKQLKPGDG